MTLFVPPARSVQYANNWTGRLATTTGDLVTASGTPHTLSGSKVQFFSSTAFDTYFIRIIVHSTFGSNSQTDQLLTIYIGDAGVEQVLIPTLLTGWSAVLSSATPGPRYYEFPLFIPGGSRLSGDLQALIASDTVEVMIELFGGGNPRGWVGSGVECVGANTAASQGVSVTPGGASEGTLTSIGTNVREFQYVQPMLQGGLTDTALNNVAIAGDIGTSSEALAGLEEFLFFSEGTESTRNLGCGRYTLIPAGTGLHIRSQTSGTVDSHDWCIYGVY